MPAEFTRSSFNDDKILAETASEILGAATPSSSAAIAASFPVPFCSALSVIKSINGTLVSSSIYLKMEVVISIRKDDNSVFDHPSKINLWRCQPKAFG